MIPNFACLNRVGLAGPACDVGYMFAKMTGGWPCMVHQEFKTSQGYIIKPAIKINKSINRAGESTGVVFPAPLQADQSSLELQLQGVQCLWPVQALYTLTYRCTCLHY